MQAQPLDPRSSSSNSVGTPYWILENDRSLVVKKQGMVSGMKFGRGVAGSILVSEFWKFGSIELLEPLDQETLDDI